VSSANPAALFCMITIVIISITTRRTELACAEVRFSRSDVPFHFL